MKTELVNYSSDNAEHIGFAAWPDADGPLPVVLVAHAWYGRDPFVEERAINLAKEGYLALAVDSYGEGKLGTNAEENTALMMPLVNDREELLRRSKAALEMAKTLNGADANNVSAIGYCFGGLTVLDMARAGLGLKGVVSFHGALPAPSFPIAPEAKNTEVMVLHGDSDPRVPRAEMNEFMDEMNAADMQWQLHAYGHAMHSFTNPKANNPEMGMMYDAVYDKRSWLSCIQFLQETLGQ